MPNFSKDAFQIDKSDVEKTSAASHAFLSALISGGARQPITGMNKTAQDVIDKLTPMRVRESKLLDRICPSKGEEGELRQSSHATNDYYYLRMYELDTPGAYNIPLDGTVDRFETTGRTYSVYTHRYRSIPQIFDIRTLEYYNTMTNLDIQKLILDSSSLDIADAVDRDGFDLFNTVVGAVDAPRTVHGHDKPQHLAFSVLDRRNLIRATKHMKRLSSKFPVETILMNTNDADELAAILTHEYAPNIAGQLLVNGITELGKINGIQYLVTTKETLCPEGTVWMFGRADVLAAHIVRRDVVVHVDKPDMTRVVLEEMFESGFAVPGVNAVVRVDFAATGDEADPYASNYVAN